MATITINLNSAAFLLREDPDGNWTVTGVSHNYPTAQAMKGLTFTPNRNPWEWESGYAARIQQQLNIHTNRDTGRVTEAFGRPITPQYPTTEVTS